MKYKVLETAASLLVGYEVLALEYNRAKGRRGSISFEDDSDETLPTKSFKNYDYTFSMLVLNASIIEGVLRSILSEIIAQDINKRVEEGNSRGQTEPSRSERLHYKFRDELEVQGGWGKLKEQYALYLNVSLDKIIPSKVKESIEVLFVLRNILAHGTAIIQPKTEMGESMKDLYPYTWQRKLQRVRVYLEKEFGHTDVFDNLAEYDVPVHFLNATKQYFEKLETEIGPIPERGKLTMERLKKYEFSKMMYSR